MTARVTVAVAFLCAALACSPSPSTATAPSPAGRSLDGSTATGELIVDMRGFRDNAGTAVVGLYLSKDGFPSDGAKAHLVLESPIAGGESVARFASAPATTIAVGVLHDADGDRKMRTGTFGIPKEGYGVSRDAPARFGPPEFDDASFVLAPHQTSTIKIHIRY